jgi:serine/threonine protein kinase
VKDSWDHNDYIENGAFASGMRDIYQRALDEELPVNDDKVEELIDNRQQLRESLLQHHEHYKEGQHWERIRQLGCGNNGTTYCIRDMESSFWLALKEEQNSKTAFDETYISLKLTSIAEHSPPNIVEFYGASLLPHPVDGVVQLFLELMPCCLQSYLFNGGPLSIEDVHNYSCQLFDALEFLHNKINLVHSDIKPGNLLIDENIQRLKVADFGCSQILDDSHQGYCMRGDANAGTLHYNPPEHFNEYRCSYALDIWQAGCCIIAMVTGRRPWRSLYFDCKSKLYRAEAQYHQRQQIVNASSHHMVPGFLDRSFKELIRRCLQADYHQRPSPRDCLSLLVQSEVVSDDCKNQWLSHLGLQPICLSLSSHSPSASDNDLLDVYLGSYIDIHYHYMYTMLPGWLGSISCDSHMTYSDVIPLIYSHIPVTRMMGSITLTVSVNSPQAIWQICSLEHQSKQSQYKSDFFTIPQPEDLVDMTKCIVLKL